MRIKHYIQGDKRGKDAHRLERDAMSDPFLQEALDGFDSVPGNHADALERLEQNIMHRASAKRRRQLIINWSVAATVLLLIGLGSYFIFQNSDKNAPVVATTQKAKPSHPSVNKPEEIVREAEQQKQTKRFTPPVIKPDDQVNEEEEMVTQDKVMESTAAVGAVNFDKGTDDVVVMPPVVQAEKPVVIKGKVVDESGAPLVGAYLIDKKDKKQAITDRDGKFALTVKDSDSLNLTANYIGYDSKEITVVPDKEKIITLNQNRDSFNDVVVVGYGSSKLKKGTIHSTSFGKKEFLEYCRNKAEKGLCDEMESSVTVEFTINDNGRPSGYKFSKFTCEKAKSEIEKLLNQSPKWTKPNQKVSVKISW
ncbi:carboxypeptidase-like regulatory domain-containing protein [Parabacteroides sp. FAFU027]|uniref:carboxypeptidase-like regulatory domain-containing protein n=1 Tax=Parabacteroides sp. FAFU027 TaxID=2922715 RepID=UPI001FAF2F78|nr:carboxypeptidase-like regulatory domain-containing protein [Parabacteroides sp. FAFU027]